MNFYKISKPLDTHYIAVSDVHELFIEEYGNKNGIPFYDTRTQGAYVLKF